MELVEKRLPDLIISLFHPIILKLTVAKGFINDSLNKKQKEILILLKKEARQNGFEISIK